ncbi:Truncated hemoglobin YjbI [Actinopolymorpha cephalotaxi]|uniref:Truncated hemoglobin YjbI n=1 Tax=Actinopolymorpha cephalotaxi TaxID=504797 RepID=A0A1I2XEZ1_9ACTN|nr:ankyrin repeat domain-containing protein [Actinopolymorpha cephalotaxi]NYH86203.1 truncated hemoglobin YjbI/ankyrin repeat protein [Actinopolymorpha cephalotaxi]SFH11589.1 Truncated hemoglobin YjbI [Actinopolymorpha cephalotaxi]
MPKSRTTPTGRQGEAVATPPVSLAHRVLLENPSGFRPFRGAGLFDRIGGQATVDRLVDALYDGFENDKELRPLFPRDLADGRAMQKVFFVEWLGGPNRYSQQAYGSLLHRHESVPITRAAAGRWLWHFRQALGATIAEEDDRQTILDQAHSLALALVNRSSPAADGRQQHVALHGVGGRIVKQATNLARRGDVGGLDAAVAEEPDLLLPVYAGAIMQEAALAGRTDVVRSLLRHGVGADVPFRLQVAIVGRAYERVVFATPLCVARLRRRSEVESLLLDAGAKEDVFTAAFLGDLPSLERMLADDGDLARSPDPAVDALDITPIDHAVAGGQVEALRLLVDPDPDVLDGGVRALRGAAEHGSVPMVELLLEHGADATRIGVGRWVLHPLLAPLLAGSGASIDSSGAWIGASCTGNQGRKDDPDYVRALLQYGARVDDRRTGEPGRMSGVEALNATALHYAAKAGFLKTIEVLLDHGADPRALDSGSRTPLDWLEEATRSVDRSEVRRLLSRRS